MAQLPKDPKQCIFAFVPLDDGSNMLTVGIPRACWVHLLSGKTMEIDLRRVGVPFTLALFGGEDQATIMSLIEQGAEAAGVDLLDKTAADFTIPKPKSN